MEPVEENQEPQDGDLVFGNTESEEETEEETPTLKAAEDTQEFVQARELARSAFKSVVTLGDRFNGDVLDAYLDTIQDELYRYGESRKPAE